jgi:hypothetical protein
MLGNTNLTLVNYNNTTNNNSMKYVDIDGDSNTLNSSMATLSFLIQEKMALIQIVLVILQGYIGQENQMIIVSHFSWVPLQKIMTK